MTLGTGPLGYRDWQRLVNWDGPLFMDLSGDGPHAGKKVYGRFDVSRFAYLGGFMRVLENPQVVLFTWYTAKTGGAQIGIRQLVLDPLILANCQFRLPNLGPWVSVQVGQGAVGEPWTLNAEVFGTNRVHPLELIPANFEALGLTEAFGGAGSRTAYPTTYFAGPMRAVVFTNAAVTVTAKLEGEGAPNVWSLLDFLTTSSALAETIIAPDSAWRIVLEATAAVTATVAITPSTTGAA